jgi:DNA primase catalytic subunit
MSPRRYLLPEGMRYSTLRERAAFYRHEFDPSKVLEWVSALPTRPIYAAVIGRHTKLYPRKYRQEAATTLIIDDYGDLEDVRRLLVELRPESVYYDRNVYRDGKAIGQELAFDLDPENMVCPVHGSLEEKMKRGQGLGFCELELEMVREASARLYEELQRRFSDVKIVYSGRGFHLHVFDREALRMPRAERHRLALSLKEKGYPLDAWVTEGSMRLIRLPYSLHGMVSRVVMPLGPGELEGFDPVRDPRCLPSFLARS